MAEPALAVEKVRSERQADGLAENYDRRDELIGDPLGAWLRAALPAAGGSAVDLACGTGRHTIVIAERYQQVLAVDLSGEMIELARRRRSAANVTYRTGDLLQVAGRFDLVFCSAALHDLPALDPALTHIRSLVAPGGRAVVADVVAPFSPMPRWFFHAAAAVYLPIDVVRRRPHALEIYRLDTDSAWIAHLSSDRYLSRAQFERRYAQHFPGATFQRARHLHVCSWNAPRQQPR